MKPIATRLAVVALAAGALGGTIGAIAIPPTAAQDPAPRREPVRVAAATPPPKSTAMVQLRRTGPITVVARTTDPDGGPEWVVRSFLADRLAERDGKTHVISRARCVQLGRMHRGTFGWIDDRGTFRPATISMVGAPIDCGSRTPDLRRDPFFSAFRRLVTPADGGPPKLGRTVAWGYAGAAARRVDVRTADRRAVGGASGPMNVVLHVIDEDTESSRMTMTVEYASGKPVVRAGSWTARLEAERSRGAKHRPDYTKPAIVAARAADPNGGLPYGIAALPAVGGGWCVRSQPGRVVEDRVGHVDFGRGTISEDQVSSLDCQSLRYLSRKQPIGAGSGGDGSADPASDPGHGRVARRTQPGTTYFGGPALPDVQTITLKSPRDVRTIVPSSPAHAYLVVYDGLFTAGEMRITSTFGDGTSTTNVFRMGF